MANKKTYIYKFEKDRDTYKLTAKAIGNLFNIERILGKVMIKNKVYELIYIQSRHNPQNNGVYLTERKNLDCEIVKSFI